jgi:hypothetical protein
MAVQAWLIFTEAERDDVILIDGGDAHVIPREIDNPLADNLGEGVLVGKFVAPARLLNDPDYEDFYAFCSVLPIRTMDSDVLFLPQEEG